MSGDRPNEAVKASEKATNPPATDKRLFGVLPFPPILVTMATLLAQLYVVFLAMKEAYRIRTYALRDFGYVIHEFDPWFNYRATEYLAKHGWHAFFHWFDYMSWYPIGRPVGTTIYPGLQITSVAIYRVLKWLGKPYRMTLNDICCTVPCWGGAAATMFLALLTYESTGSRTAAAIAAVVMAIIPAHIMRSVGGGYDNESIAMTAMLMTFYFWVRSLRTPSSWPIGIIAGLAYGYMVAAWGGFIFVLNMVALHTFVGIMIDWCLNRFDHNLCRAYALFYIVGTAIAVRVPPVNTTPFKSLEQLSATVVFILMMTLYASERCRMSQKEPPKILSIKGFAIRARYLLAVGAVVAAIVAMLWPTGFFGPLSSRVRGLFLIHTRTGNPLVDSVAEHQPASRDAYWQYLHYGCYGWVIGTVVVTLFCCWRRPHAARFLILYSAAAGGFSLRMARLIILSGPVASAGVGATLGLFIDWVIDQFYYAPAEDAMKAAPTRAKKSDAATTTTTSGGKGKNAKSNKAAESAGTSDAQAHDILSMLHTARRVICNVYKKLRPVRQTAAVALLAVIVLKYKDYWEPFQRHSDELAQAFSSPQIMFKTRLSNGQPVIVDDYREAYHWLRDKTPQDSRVMAWWDYGYQITGIGKRTSIADGNTWNHEHIATLGKCLTSPVKEAHSLIRHLADYVLVWAGGGGDDLGKSPHMARIGNSVYRDICPNDPLCSHFGFYSHGFDKPTPSMARSLLYHLSTTNLPGSKAKLDSKLFKLAYQTRYGLVRIFKVMNVSQESKDWVADPKNRVCDAPGSWYCVGQYPPAKEIQRLLKKRIDFGQLEDFNRNKRDNKYVEEYLRRLGNN